VQSGRKKTREPKEENVTFGPAVREGEYVFGVAHIFASFNDTFIVSIPRTLHPCRAATGGASIRSVAWDSY
jgi:ribosomal protein S11